MDRHEMSITILVATVITVAMLGLGGLMTKIDAWYRDLRKPSWNPPNWLFGPAWTIILALAAWAGVSAWDAAPTGGDHGRIAALFGVNIVLHALWSPLFFNLRRPDWALIEAPLLWLSVAALMVGLTPYSHLAPWLLAPYLLWVSFAVVLNAVIVRMNGPFGVARRPAA
jgi:tryptophan-rich sensory protein